MSPPLLSPRGSPPPTRGGALKSWEKVGDDVYRTKVMPHGYAVIQQDRAVLIDAAVPPEAVAELGVKTVEAVLLAHHRGPRSRCAAAGCSPTGH